MAASVRVYTSIGRGGLYVLCCGIAFPGVGAIGARDGVATGWYP